MHASPDAWEKHCQREVDDYVDRILNGQTVAGRLEKLTCQRYQDDCKRFRRRSSPYYFDAAVATRAIKFCEIVCRHSKGEFAGRPFVLSGWQKFIVWNLFGWRRQKDGTRRFRKALIEVARKNGKSTLAAALALLLLLADEPKESVSEVYCVAAKEDQARKIVFAEAQRMVVRSPALRRRLDNYVKSIDFPATDSYLTVLGSDSDTTQGLSPHGVIIDELHAFRKRHRGLLGTMTSGGGSRSQPLTLIITTAGDDQSAIWIAEHDLAVRIVEAVLTGEPISETYFVFIAAIDAEKTPCKKCSGTGKRASRKCRPCNGSGEQPGDNPLDPRIWPKANPNLDISCSRDYLTDEAELAKASPEKLNEFRRYQCNVQTGSMERAILPEAWAGCGGKLQPLAGRECYGAFDLGRSDDWAGLALTFPFQMKTANGIPWTWFEILAWSFTCVDRPAALQTAHLSRWIAPAGQRPLERGALFEHPGNQIDFTAIENFIVELSQHYNVRTWAYDPTFAHQLAQNLYNTHGLPIFKFTQSPKFYNEPLREFLKLVKRRELCHGDCPILAWQAGNLRIRRNSYDEWQPDKADSPGKIDAMVAVLMAYSEALFHRGESERSIYEQENVKTIG